LAIEVNTSLKGIFIIVILSCYSQISFADENDLNLLTPISIEIPLYKKLHGILEGQFVAKDSLTQAGRAAVSPSLQYELTEHVAVQAGYSNIHTFPPGEHEQTHGLFQSVFVHHRAKILPGIKKDLYIGHAFTAEQEIFPGNGTSSSRSLSFSDREANL